MENSFDTTNTEDDKPALIDLDYTDQYLCNDKSYTTEALYESPQLPDHALLHIPARVTPNPVLTLKHPPCLVGGQLGRHKRLSVRGPDELTRLESNAMAPREGLASPSPPSVAHQLRPRHLRLLIHSPTRRVLYPLLYSREPRSPFDGYAAGVDACVGAVGNTGGVGVPLASPRGPPTPFANPPEATTLAPRVHNPPYTDLPSSLSATQDSLPPLSPSGPQLTLASATSVVGVGLTTSDGTHSLASGARHRVLAHPPVDKSHAPPPSLLAAPRAVAPAPTVATTLGGEGGVSPSASLTVARVIPTPGATASLGCPTSLSPEYARLGHTMDPPASATALALVKCSSPC